MSQGNLFPIDVLWEEPSSLNTADCSTFCRGEDGADYAVKDARGGSLVPHSEWFCTHLADMVGIAGPPCRILRMLDGTLAFGSRWEGNPLEGTAWADKVMEGVIPKPMIFPLLSKIYVLDNFVHNVDRHGANYLCRPQRQGYAFLAFDYSRSWLCNGFPLPDLPLPEGSLTRKVCWQIKGMMGNFIETDVCDEVNERIRKVSVDSIRSVIEGHPEDWLPKELKEDVLDWWGSALRGKRLDGISEGIHNGSYI